MSHQNCRNHSIYAEGATPLLRRGGILSDNVTTADCDGSASLVSILAVLAVYAGVDVDDVSSFSTLSRSRAPLFPLSSLCRATSKRCLLTADPVKSGCREELCLLLEGESLQFSDGAAKVSKLEKDVSQSRRTLGERHGVSRALHQMGCCWPSNVVCCAMTTKAFRRKGKGEGSRPWY